MSALFAGKFAAPKHRPPVVSARSALVTLTKAVSPHLVDCNGLPGVLNTIGECAELHNAQRAALAVLEPGKKQVWK